LNKNKSSSTAPLMTPSSKLKLKGRIMKIAVIGSGNMGSSFVKQLRKAGHTVLVTSQNKTSALTLATDHGATVVEASKVRDAEIIILATGAADAISALKTAGDLNGKVVVDITNPLTADYMGLTIGHSTSNAEEIANAFPGIRLVKGFNTVFAQLLGAGGALSNGGKITVFLASDDTEAKNSVTNLAQSMGFGVTDAGPLKNARYLEPLAGLNIYFGYGAGRGTGISPTWVEAA
jgi:8-hydroxy-5-deazaflavin:NADPH oxidoreductase